MPIPKLPLGIGVPPAASNLAILSRSEPFVLLFALLLEFVVVGGGSGREEVGLKFGEMESFSAGSVVEERQYDPSGFCELAVWTLSYSSTCKQVVKLV